MREIASELRPSESRALLIGFAICALALMWIGVALSLEVFGSADPSVLGVNIGLGFAVLAIMTVLYYRLVYPHRIVVEHGEDLW